MKFSRQNPYSPVMLNWLHKPNNSVSDFSAPLHGDSVIWYAAGYLCVALAHIR